MHELGITQNIVAIATEHAHGARVRRITLEIGQLTAIMPEAIRFCFDVCAQGTVLEGATLEILERPGLGKCRDCDRQADCFDWCKLCGGLADRTLGCSC